MNDKPEHKSIGDKPIGDKPIEHKGRIIRAEIRTKATPQQAYDAWADPEKIAHWFPDRAEGKAEPGATITWIFDKFNYRIPYEVLIAEPAEKFAIRWNPPPGMNAGVLEVTISKEGGETVIRLVNSGFREGAEWDEEFEGTDSGWRMALALLKHYLENYYGTSRASFLVIRPAEFSFEQAVQLQRSAAGLRKWLTKSGEYGEVGEYFALELMEGGKASGRVLAKTKRETTLGWDEIHGVLELKAFSMGPQKMLCVRGCGWGLSAEKAKELEGQMERAVERLARTVSEGNATA
jgi:uncharacterized protein YndB with AHSA1/START domain